MCIRSYRYKHARDNRGIDIISMVMVLFPSIGNDKRSQFGREAPQYGIFFNRSPNELKNPGIPEGCYQRYLFITNLGTSISTVILSIKIKKWSKSTFTNNNVPTCLKNCTLTANE
ncbi:hypothetical protein HZS_5564 [Henneguya salminicola]|nr:hypothetical protein HZS_5564 [Henneguya salminicola]